MPILKNAKHEKCCLEYLKNGCNRIQAYVSVYQPNKKPKDVPNANVLAHNIFSRDDVKARIEELQHLAETTTVADVKEIREYWTKTMRDSDENTRNRLQASENLGKSLGIFVDVQVTKDVSTGLGGLTTQQLLDMLGTNMIETEVSAIAEDESTGDKEGTSEKGAM